MRMTAALLALCCAASAQAGQQPEDYIEKLEESCQLPERDPKECKRLRIGLEKALAKQKWDEGAEDRGYACVRQWPLRIGMTADDLRASCFGRPSAVDRTVTARGTFEQWIYKPYQSYHGWVTIYVYVNNGIVSAFQHPTR